MATSFRSCWDWTTGLIPGDGRIATAVWGEPAAAARVMAARIRDMPQRKFPDSGNGPHLSLQDFLRPPKARPHYGAPDEGDS